MRVIYVFDYREGVIPLSSKQATEAFVEKIGNVFHGEAEIIVIDEVFSKDLMKHSYYEE